MPSARPLTTMTPCSTRARVTAFARLMPSGVAVREPTIATREPSVSREVSPAVYNASGAFFSSARPSGPRASLVLSSACSTVLAMPFTSPPSPLILHHKFELVQYYTQTHICSFVGYPRLIFQFLGSRRDICLQLTDHLPVGRTTSGLEPRVQTGR